MSLKIEQRLSSEIFTEFKPRIYSTGAFLVPMCVSLKNQKRYVWVVDEFNEATFDTDGSVCEPKICSNEIEGLI